MMKIVLSFILIILSQSVFAQKIINEVVYSEKMGRSVDVVVVLPDVQKDVSYKSVYILHGFSGNPERTYKQDIPDLLRKANEFKTIYIIPDGNFSSWYIDSPLDKTSQYQTFISTELIGYIDAKYPTKKEFEARGILGWSMGGYGALHIGLKNVNTFSVIGSTCGAIDFRQFGPYYEQFKVDQILGEVENIDDFFLIYQYEETIKSTNQKLILDCGTEDILINMNRSYHNYLVKNKIDHQYIEYPGNHDTDYWSKALSVQLLLFNESLK